MASKDDDGDNNISEKKRSRIKALEHKLSSIVSSKLPTSLSSHQSSQTKNQEKKKKITSTKAMTHFTSTPTTNKLLLASTIVSRSSELEDSEANDPAYFQLCESVHENLLGSYLQHSGGQAGGGTINGILHDLLKSGDKADKYTKGASSIKEQDKFLLLDSRTLPGGASTRARIRALRSRGKRSKKHMSMRQHRQYGSFDFPRKYQNYNLYAPMHEMWKEYIRQILRDCRQKNIEPCLLTADFHGAIFVVLESKIKSFTGVQGIMIRETVNTFGILTSENRFRVVPKKGSVFMFQVDFWQVILHGDNLSSRNLNQDILAKC